MTVVVNRMHRTGDHRKLGMSAHGFQLRASQQVPTSKVPQRTYVCLTGHSLQLRYSTTYSRVGTLHTGEDIHRPSPPPACFAEIKVLVASIHVVRTYI